MWRIRHYVYFGTFILFRRRIPFSYDVTRYGKQLYIRAFTKITTLSYKLIALQSLSLFCLTRNLEILEKQLHNSICIYIYIYTMRKLQQLRLKVPSFSLFLNLIVINIKTRFHRGVSSRILPVDSATRTISQPLSAQLAREYSTSGFSSENTYLCQRDKPSILRRAQNARVSRLLI